MAVRHFAGPPSTALFREDHPARPACRRGGAGRGGFSLHIAVNQILQILLPSGTRRGFQPALCGEIGYSGQWSDEARDDAANARLSVQF